jgi:hypothetical protein
MARAPHQLSDDQRALLGEFERLHARWRVAVAAANARECGVAADEVAAGSRLRQALEADEACRLAMRLLREHPL